MIASRVNDVQTSEGEGPGRKTSKTSAKYSNGIKIRKKDSCILCDFASIVERVSSRNKSLGKEKISSRKLNYTPKSSTGLNFTTSNVLNGFETDGMRSAADNFVEQETMEGMNYFYEEIESECRLCRVATQVGKMSKISCSKKVDITTSKTDKGMKLSSICDIDSREGKGLLTTSIEQLYKSLEKIHKNYLNTSRRLSILENEKTNRDPYKNDEKVKPTCDGEPEKYLSKEVIIENPTLDETNLIRSERQSITDKIDKDVGLLGISGFERKEEIDIENLEMNLLINKNDGIRENDLENIEIVNSSDHDTEGISFPKTSSSDSEEKTSENSITSHLSKSVSIDSFSPDIAIEIQRGPTICDWTSGHEYLSSTEKDDTETKMLDDRITKLEEDVSRMSKAIKSQFNDPMEYENGFFWKRDFQIYPLIPHKGDLGGKTVDFVSRLMYLEGECLTEMGYLHKKKEAIDHLAGMAFAWGPMIHR